MHDNLPPRHSFSEGTLDGQWYADAHDPKEGGEHQVACHQPVPRRVLQPPVAAGAVVYEDHEYYCHPTEEIVIQ